MHPSRLTMNDFNSAISNIKALIKWDSKTQNLSFNKSNNTLVLAEGAKSLDIDVMKKISDVVLNSLSVIGHFRDQAIQEILNGPCYESQSTTYLYHGSAGHNLNTFRDFAERVENIVELWKKVLPCLNGKFKEEFEKSEKTYNDDRWVDSRKVQYVKQFQDKITELSKGIIFDGSCEFQVHAHSRYGEVYTTTETIIDHGSSVQTRVYRMYSKPEAKETCSMHVESAILYIRTNPVEANKYTDKVITINSKSPLHMKVTGTMNKDMRISHVVAQVVKEVNPQTLTMNDKSELPEKEDHFLHRKSKLGV